MKPKFYAITITLLLTQILFAQNKMPVIKAGSKYVDIKEDSKLLKNVWIINPKLNPDVYITSAKRVTFYTDIDSISFTINPQENCDFIIMLNEKDTAVTRISYEPPKLEILQKAKDYNYSDNRFVPKFSYQSQNDSSLVRVRKELNLDSIAGSGKELTKIFNLLHWVHNLIKHDGNSSNPAQKNAIELIKVCNTEKRGVNCRMLATILNECYLSMGIKSRFVTCMPRETKFNDCHVINMVFSNDLNKWIWIDPTFDAYIMDENGNLLGIQEVRERLIKDLPLILNADANRNREEIQQKEYYLGYYMAKNLYRLEAPLVSEFNTETSIKGKEFIYVELLPLDGIEQLPQKQERTSQKTGVKYTNYKTNNPDLFWTKPE